MSSVSNAFQFWVTQFKIFNPQFPNPVQFKSSSRQDMKNKKIKNVMQNGQNSVAGSEATNGGVSGTIGKLAENVQINVF